MSVSARGARANGSTSTPWRDNGEWSSVRRDAWPRPSGLDVRAGGRRASQEADEAPLSASVAVDVALRRLDGSVPSEQLHVAQAATAGVDVAGGAGDEGAPTGVGRAPFEAEFPEQSCKPVDHAGGPQITAAGGANDRTRRFAGPQQPL